jgi:hypothetical protein
MTRILIIVGLTSLVASAVGSAEAVPASHGPTTPAAPRILGPRRTTDRTPTFQFVSQEVGVLAREIRFRCAVDRAKLHACSTRYTPTLKLGQHVLRVRAVDPRGRTSRTSVARLSVLLPTPRAEQTIRVGNAPYNLAAGFGSVWVTVSGGLVRLDPATGAVVARISVGNRPWGVAVGEGAVWVGNWTDGTFPGECCEDALLLELAPSGSIEWQAAYTGGVHCFDNQCNIDTAAGGALWRRKPDQWATRVLAEAPSGEVDLDAAALIRVFGTHTFEPPNSSETMWSISSVEP